MSSEISVWGRGSSSNVQKVLWLCDELGLTPRRHNVGGPFGGLDTPEFLAMNPNGTVPVLQDGNLVLWESHAILRYLANQYATSADLADLYPSDPLVRAPIDKWLDWYANNFWPPIRMFFRGYWQRDDVGWDDPAIVKARSDFDHVATIVAGQLRQMPFMAGSNFSLADMPIAIGINRLQSMHLDIELPTELQTWFQTVSARPGFAVGTAEENV